MAPMALKRMLVEAGWRQQEEHSRCTNADDSIQITWWNRGKSSLLVAEQGGSAFVYAAKETAKQMAAVMRQPSEWVGERAQRGVEQP
jgi:hypothetical protein